MIAALILAGGLAMTGVAVKPEKPPTAGEIADQKRLETCVDMIAEDPEEAYEQAMAWGNETKAPEAKRCAALAMVGRGEPAVGAQQLEDLAQAKDAGDMAVRGELLVASGNAWMIAERPDRAIAVLTAALKLAEGSPEVLTDRARAYAMARKWREAEDDCTVVINAKPKDAYALTLRAKARLEQKVWDLARKDAENAIAIEPKNEMALGIRGAAIEGKRLAGVKPN